MKSRRKEWREFVVGPDPADFDCSLLDSATHVSHVPHAWRITEESLIRPQLIYDVSRLNKSRTLVNWLSPNYWHDGSRYGNIGFEYSWNYLIRGRVPYWVEVIRKYKPPACRILFVNADSVQPSDLEPFDPGKRDGPWWYDTGTNTHYCNAKICLEILVADELSLSGLQRLSLVDHHPRFCSLWKGEHNCGYKNVKGPHAGALFLAGLFGASIDTGSLRLMEVCDGHQELTAEADTALEQLRRQTGKLRCRFRGKTTNRSKAAVPIAKAVLMAFAKRFEADASALGGLFVARDDFDRAICQVIQESLSR